MLLGTTVGDAEARHDLVKDEQGAVLVAEPAEPLEERLCRHDESSVANNRLQHDGSDLALGSRHVSAGHLLVYLLPV